MFEYNLCVCNLKEEHEGLNFLVLLESVSNFLWHNCGQEIIQDMYDVLVNNDTNIARLQSEKRKMSYGFKIMP